MGRRSAKNVDDKQLVHTRAIIRRWDCGLYGIIGLYTRQGWNSPFEVTAELLLVIIDYG